MEIFSTRELAVGFWLCAFIAFVLYKENLRGMVPGLFKYAFAKRLRPVYAVALIYIILIVTALSELGLWTADHLKSTIIWTVSVAFISLFRLPDKAEDFIYFRQIIADNLKLIVIIEFVISSYTFTLWIELLIVPVATFLTLMAEFSKNKPEFKIVHTLFTSLMAVLGTVILGMAFYQLFGDFKSFATVRTLSDFSLPPILTFMFLPFLYCLAVYAIYERVFLAMQIFVPDEAVRRHAQLKSLVTFRNDVRLLRRWQRDIAISGPKTKTAVDQSISDVLRRCVKEQNPKDIPFDQGWSPYRAKEFLADRGLTSDDYHRTLPELNDWSASSNHLDLGTGVLPNHISYYVDGDEEAAKQLKLVLNVNETDHAAADSETFTELANTLIQQALDVELPAELREAILSNIEASATIKGKPVSVTYERFTGKFEGFTAYFTIGDHQPSYLTAGQSPST